MEPRCKAIFINKYDPNGTHYVKYSPRVLEYLLLLTIKRRR